MKALLICPGRLTAVALLAESGPLAVAPMLGKCLVEYWIEHLVTLGAREILIAASDRADQVGARVGDGARWGLPIAVRSVDREFSAEQASEKYRGQPDGLPEFLVRMDHLPGRPGRPLFASYAGWFAALRTWMPWAQAVERIGQCEVQPGVWVGRRARLAPSAQLLPPCWLGDYVSVGEHAVIGPGAILEDGAVVAAGARVEQSVVGPATFVGAHTVVENSLAHRHTLINWTTNSCLRVPDAFWLSSLDEPTAATRPAGRSRPMHVAGDGHTLSIAGLDELSAANAARFRDIVAAAFSPRHAVIEIDLAQMRFLDSCGLATLCGLRRRAGASGISLRLLNPGLAVRQLLELTQAHQFFEIGRTEVLRPGFSPPALPQFKPVPAFVSAHYSNAP